MKKQNDNDLDKLFRDGLTDPEAPVSYREADWKDMARLLDGKSDKKGGVLRIVYYVTGVAALLLVAFTLFIINNKQIPGAPQHKLTNGSLITKRAEGRQPTLQSHVTKPEASAAKGTTLSPGVDFSQPLLTAYQVKIPVPEFKLPQSSDSLKRELPSTAPADNPIAIAATTATVTTDSLKQLLATDNPVDTTAVMPKDKPLLNPNKKQTDGTPRLALALLGAPDLNSVNSLNGGQMGVNVSLLLSVKLTNKLSVTTGAAYAIKPYQSSFAQYNSNFNPAVQPTNVAANCQVLDVPVNINYQVYTKGSNSFTLGTGLSSYFMLKEKYRFDYDEASGAQAYTIMIAGRNQHILGVLNLNATYQRRINSKFSAVIQPYLKLPLTGIGNGQVNLKSTGVAVGFNWNINSLRKPR
jgi:hypothetical protein